MKLLPCTKILKNESVLLAVTNFGDIILTVIQLKILDEWGKTN